MTVGERIKERRLELGLSQEQLANRLGNKSRASVSTVEHDKEDLTMERVVKYAKALEINPAYLVGWAEKEDPITRDSPMLSAASEMIDNEAVSHIYRSQYLQRFAEKYLDDTTMNLVRAYSTAEDYIKKAVNDLLKINEDPKTKKEELSNSQQGA